MITEGTLVRNIRRGDEILTYDGRAKVTSIFMVEGFIQVEMDVKDRAERTWFYSHECVPRVIEG